MEIFRERCPFPTVNPRRIPIHFVRSYGQRLQTGFPFSDARRSCPSNVQQVCRIAEGRDEGLPGGGESANWSFWKVHECGNYK